MSDLEGSLHKFGTKRSLDENNYIRIFDYESKYFCGKLEDKFNS
jgi:hypothetical protein